ncbi:MAG: YfhO family protein [candidate division WS1 bacterium]|nr:YfhO family protein [candidate division WS1 bacterium]
MTRLLGSSRARDIACLLALAIFALLLLWPVTLGGQVLLTAQVMLSYDPWHHHLGEFPELSHAKGYPLLDPVNQILPAYDFIGEQLREDVLPLWNPRQYFGSPFLALSGALYPEVWLHLFPNAERVLSWSAVLFLFLAGAAAFAFLRTLGCQRPAALFGALGFMTNGFFVAWLHWPAVRAAFLWLPVILLCYERAVRGRSVPWALAGAVAVGLHFLSGFAQMSIYLMLVIGLYGLGRVVRAFRRGRWSSAGWPLLALATMVLLGAGLAAGQLLPTFELGGSSLRFNTYEEQLCYGLPPVGLLSGFFPHLFGHPIEAPLWGEYLAVQQRAFIEITWGLSGAVWLLALAALVLRPRTETWFWIGVAVLGSLLALNRGANALLYFTVPGFSKLNAITRSLVIPATAVPLLAGLGLDALLTASAGAATRRRRVALLGSGLGLMAVGLLAMFAVRAILPTTRFWAMAQELISYADRQVFKCCLVVALSLALGMLCLGRFRRPAVVGLMLVVAVEGYLFLHAFALTSDPKYLHIQTAIIPVLRAGEQPHRFLSVGDHWKRRLPPNHAMNLGLEDIQGYFPLVPERTERLLEAIGRQAIGHLQPDWRLPAVDFLNVRDVFSRSPLASTEKYVPLPGDYEVYLYRNRQVLPRAYVPRQVRQVADAEQVLAEVASPAFRPHEEALVETPVSGVRQEPAPLSIADYGINSFRIVGEQPWRGLTVVSMGYWPGWHARAEGQQELSLHPANYAITGLVVGPEPARWVSMFYYPASFAVGFFLGCLTAAAVLTCAILTWRRSSRPRFPWRPG